MDRKRFGEIMLWLEGAYERAFSEQAHKAAWSLLAGYPNDIVGNAANLMVDEGENFPSPAMWFRRVKIIQAERRRAEQMQLTQDKIDGSRQLPHASESSGYEEFKRTLAILTENIGRSAPEYPGMGVREVLAVRALIEHGGKTHDEAYAVVLAARKGT